MLEAPGLLQGYCKGHQDGASADIALYGEGATGLTRLRAVVQGAPAKLHLWWPVVASVFGGDARADAVRWMNTRKRGTGRRTFDRLGMTFSDTIVTREYVVVDVESAKDGTSIDLEGPQLPDDAEEALADLFAPSFVFHPAEPFRPLAIGAYTSQTQVCRFRRAGERVTADECSGDESAPPRAQCDPPSRTGDCYLALDVLGAVEDRDSADHIRAEVRMREASLAPTVYWHVVSVNKHRVVVQYWLLYSYNDYSGKLGMNKHEGDWEHIDVDVRADKRSGLPVPVAVAYSAHQGFATRVVPEARGRSLWRPVVYVALGSHANYFKPRRLFYPVCIDLDGRCVPVGREKVSGAGKTLLPREPGSRCSYRLEPLTGAAPPWIYGAVNVVIFPGGRSTSHGRGPADPRTRDVWQRPLSSFDPQSDKPVPAVQPPVCR